MNNKKWFIVDNNGNIEQDKKWVIKKCKQYEKEIFEIFSRFYHNSSSLYNTLYVPKSLDNNILEQIKTKYNIAETIMGLEYIEGTTYTWSEHSDREGYGGNGIETDNIDRIIDCLKELSGFTNNDFQFRNLIFMQDGKVALIDYESMKYNPYQLEHDASYFYILMWNNPEWQKHFLERLKVLTSVDKNRFETFFLRNLYKLKHTWNRNKELCDVLNKTYMDYRYFNAVWNGINIKELVADNYQFFDDLMKGFDVTKHSNSVAKLNAIKLPDVRNKTILDIGCSSGYFPLMYCRMGANKVTGIDCSENVIQKAQKLAKIYELDIEYDTISIFDISKKFDIITSFSMIHYIEGKKIFIDKIYDLLKSEGLFILEMPIRDHAYIDNIEPPRYYISENDLMNIVYGKFELVYSGISNLLDRKVYHFKKVNHGKI